ncbi:hypothetical protein [Stappia sp.]|uniref:hypothetical protein n=1 Tax=Stappia sp. TaxID=1870903 RepID=UPI003A992305
MSGLNGHDLTARAMLTRLALLLVLLATQAFAETREVRFLNRNRTGAMPLGPNRSGRPARRSRLALSQGPLIRSMAI